MTFIAPASTTLSTFSPGTATATSPYPSPLKFPTATNTPNCSQKSVLDEGSQGSDWPWMSVESWVQSWLFVEESPVGPPNRMLVAPPTGSDPTVSPGTPTT